MKGLLSISEMAKIHSISRQALIHYDKIGLFKPMVVDENGYRYYSFNQIPFLREICYLKSVGIKLKYIKKHIENRNLDSSISLLRYHKDFLGKEIQKMLTIYDSIENRIEAYEKAEDNNQELYLPTIEYFPKRRVVFLPYENELCKEELHITMMKAWNMLEINKMQSSNRFGTIILKNSIKKSNIFEGAGVYIILNNNADDSKLEDAVTLPEGKYACMYKYGMPYQKEYLNSLLKWIEDNEYTIIGDIIDECILDSTFYKSSTDVDFCQLQIHVEKY
ncbi:MerR family transcriptional regulator [Sedimentibacter sp.]|uniref:MerR family transcriptional regulator n=1 Tax=Sedimentibacter sp. TaxID=1960295 RepID=UPI0028AA15FA|nr:MerR family transcriptional regulator [Sedimentibacter sp.]